MKKRTTKTEKLQEIQEKRAERNRRRRKAYLNAKRQKKNQSKKTYSKSFPVKRNILTTDKRPLSFNNNKPLTFWQKIKEWFKNHIK